MTPCDGQKCKAVRSATWGYDDFLLDNAFRESLHSVGSGTMNAVEAVVLSVLSALKKSPEARKHYLQILRDMGDDPLLKKSKLNDKVTIRLSKSAEDMVDQRRKIVE